MEWIILCDHCIGPFIVCGNEQQKEAFVYLSIQNVFDLSEKSVVHLKT